MGVGILMDNQRVGVIESSHASPAAVVVPLIGVCCKHQQILQALEIRFDLAWPKDEIAYGIGQGVHLPVTLVSQFVLASHSIAGQCRSNRQRNPEEGSQPELEPGIKGLLFFHPRLLAIARYGKISFTASRPT